MNVLLVLISVLPALAVFNCRPWPHTAREAAKYVERTISKSPFVLSGGANDGKITYWRVYFKDKPDYIFWVYSSRTALFGIPTGYRLHNNFDAMFSYYYFNELGENPSNLLYAVKQDDYDRPYYTTTRITGHYTALQDARILAHTIEAYYTAVKRQPYPAQLAITCCLAGPDGTELGRFYLFFDEPYRQKPMLAPFSTVIAEANARNIEGALLQFRADYLKSVKDFNSRLPDMNEKRQGNGLPPLPPRSEQESGKDYWRKNR
ncbi:MAG: hypothetical protein LBD13_05045 [Spirochaetaceae bacterium]|nr:hypothetical protein [Spirochaetaceae bacterium]